MQLVNDYAITQAQVSESQIFIVLWPQTTFEKGEVT
jgi:hypothetical protein